MGRSRITKPRDKPKIRSSSAGVRSSDIPFGDNITPENEDMKGEKRRKFPDPDTDHLQNNRPNACSLQYEPIHHPDAPKTSEYAFFKKLKQHAGQSDWYPQHKQDDQVKNVDINNCRREKSRTLKQVYNGFRFSVPIGKERPDDHNCFSPPVCASKSSEIINVVGPSGGTNIRFPSLNQKVTPVNHNPWPSIFHGDPNNSGKQYSEKGVFSSKRQKLRQWVAETSLHEVDELCSKGFNLVNALLSRLFPEGNEDNRGWEPKFNQVEIDTRCQLPPFPNYDTHSRGHHWSHTNNVTESENGSYQDGGFSRYWCESHRDVILPELDNVGADSPSTGYPIKTHFQCKYRIPCCNLDGRTTESLFTESNSRFHLSSFEEYGYVAGDHLKELERFHDPNGSTVRGLPHTLLLGWDYKDEKDERDLSILSINTDMSLLANSRDNDHWQGHDRHNESALCSSSLFSNYFLNCTSLALPNSASFLCTRDFGRHFKDEKYLFPKLDNHLPLTFSCSPNSAKFLDQMEDCTSDSIFKHSSFVCSPQDHRWSLNKVIYEKHDLDLARNHLSLSDSSTEYPLSFIHALEYPQHDESAAYFLGDEEEKEYCLYDSNWANDFSEDTLKCHDWSSLNFQISCKLHSSSCSSPKPERYHTEADDDNEWKFI